MTNTATAPAVDRFLGGVESGTMPEEIFSDDAVLDATVPNWRFTVRGGAAVREQLGGWFADPGQFIDLRRTPLPDGTLVEFCLSWEENGVEHGCHQAHILRLRDGRICADTAFCGGRWPAPLMAEMAQAGEESA